MEQCLAVFPWNHPVKQDGILRKTEITVYIFFFFSEFDGLFLSSGPGDPQTQCPDTVATIKSWIDSETIKPVFGISLGHQVKILSKFVLWLYELTFS